jgi:hypothetical protein
MAQTRSYNPADWVITWNGILFQAFAKDSKIKVTLNAELASMEAGCDGDVVIVGSNDRTGKVELTLQAESPTNNLLSAQATAFQQRPRVRGAGQGPFLARNLNNPGTLAQAAIGVIEKWPEMTGAAKNSPVPWSILLDNVTIFFGGAVA